MAHMLKVLYVDIETAPIKAYLWSPWNNYVAHTQIIEDSYMLTWAAKWHGQRKVMGDKLTLAEVNNNDDKRIVENLASLIREADVVIAHNGDKFDLPRLNARVMYHELEPLGPVETIDTLKLVKQSFNVPYKKLDYLVQWLFDEHKIKTDFDLWVRADNGDLKALKEMLRYNRKDVRLLEELFIRIIPYVKKLRRLFDGVGCPHCGSASNQIRGYKRTAASTFRYRQCNDCKRYFRERTSVKELNPEYVPA